MAIHNLDARGLKCPQPTLKITAMAVRMKPGDILEAVADCPTFEKMSGNGVLVPRRSCSGFAMKAAQRNVRSSSELTDRIAASLLP